MKNVRKGIDISEHNGSVDFKRIKKAGYSFVVIRASYGEDNKDSRLSAGRVRAARAAGLIVGFYHYAYPSGNDAKTEARRFVNSVRAVGGWKRGDLKPVLDIEESKLGGSATHRWCATFIKEVKRLTGSHSIVYTGSYWRDNIPASASGLGAPLWLAAYVDHPDEYVPAPWKRARWGGLRKPWSWAIWQYSSTARVPGVSGNCDVNYWKNVWDHRCRVGWPVTIRKAITRK